MDLVVARKISQESPSYISRLEGEEENEERVCCCSGGVMAGWCCCGNLASRPFTMCLQAEASFRGPSARNSTLRKLKSAISTTSHAREPLPLFSSHSSISSRHAFPYPIADQHGHFRLSTKHSLLVVLSLSPLDDPVDRNARLPQPFQKPSA